MHRQTHEYFLVLSWCRYWSSAFPEPDTLDQRGLRGGSPSGASLVLVAFACLLGAVDDSVDLRLAAGMVGGRMGVKEKVKVKVQMMGLFGFYPW